MKDGAADQGGEQRRHRDQHADIGSQGVGQGGVLKQEIQGHPAQPRRHDLPFAAQGLAIQPAPRQARRADGEQHHHRQGDPVEHNLHRGEVHHQDLGGDEGDAPDEDGEEGSQVTEERLVGLSHLPQPTKSFIPGLPPGVELQLR